MTPRYARATRVAVEVPDGEATRLAVDSIHEEPWESWWQRA